MVGEPYGLTKVYDGNYGDEIGSRAYDGVGGQERRSKEAKADGALGIWDYIRGLVSRDS